MNQIHQFISGENDEYVGKNLCASIVGTDYGPCLLPENHSVHEDLNRTYKEQHPGFVPKPEISIEKLAEALEWWENDGWRIQTDAQLWPDGDYDDRKTEFKIAATEILKRINGDR